MQSVYLVRHGEVHNPRHVVYAELPGYVLSRRGIEQAEDVGHRLASRRIGRVVTSPLERARQTASIIAQATDAPIAIDGDLTEWRLSARWAGVVWEELPHHFPGELDAYLDHPEDLPFSPESLDELSARVVAAVHRHGSEDPTVFVSHQDPIQAGRLALTATGWDRFGGGKPGHAGAVGLVGEGTTWREVEYWEPSQGDPFPITTRP